jgi:conjugative transposon TraM protein
MQQTTHSPKFLRQRKFYVVLPVLVIPFMTLMFWALGGGKASMATTPSQGQKGYNMQLPDAHLKKDRPLDKLSYYEKAASDSAKLKELIKNDPYYTHQTALDLHLNKGPSLPEVKYKSTVSTSGSRLNPSPYSGSAYPDSNEAKVYQKLEQLNSALNKATGMSGIEATDSPVHSRSGPVAVNGADMDRLEQMMQMVGQKGNEDLELQQLNSMLEKILDIQHPQRVSEKIKLTSDARKGQVFAVSINSEDDPVSFLGNANFKKSSGDINTYQPIVQNSFYSMDDATAVNALQNAIEAVVHETQTVVSGSTVKLRLTGDVYINGVLIPKDNFLFGTASLQGERLNININSIRHQNSLFPVELSVYDMDGMDGIYIPGAITRDVAKQSADRAIQDIGFNTFDPSLKVQAASAGVEAAKSLFSKKVKLVKVQVKAGYQVLLRDEKQQQHD